MGYSNYHYTKKWKEKHKDKVREQKIRYRNKHGKNIKEYHKKWREDNKEEVNKNGREYSKRYRENPINKERIKIRREAYDYLRNEFIKKYKHCQMCPSKENLELHHNEYKNNEKSLLLLCKSCHTKIHRKEKQM
jgi:hypothetical protein